MLLVVRSLKYYEINILLQNICHTDNTDNISYTSYYYIITVGTSVLEQSQTALI
jgi:hypothetical protein